MSARWGRWPDWAAAAMGVLVLAAGFFPWYQIDWVVGRFGFVTHHSFAADAWDASTSWSFAILLGVAAAAALVTVALGLPPPRWRLAVRLAAVALVVVGLALALGPWLAMQRPTPQQATLRTTRGGAPPPAIGTIRRDALIVFHAPGFDADVSWGFTAGLAALALELGAATAAAVIATRR